MEERTIDRQVSLIAHDESTKAAQPAERSLDLPPAPVPAQGSTILGFPSVRSLRGDQLDPPPRKLASMPVTVIRLVANHPLRLRLRPAGPGTRDADRRERRLEESDLCRRGRAQVDSQRKTLAVAHHHPLRTFSPLGATDSSAPPLAGAKLPSTKASSHSRCPRRSSFERNVRHIRSQTPCSSHIFKRRQHVDPLGYSAGRSRQRAPVFSTQRMPSNADRESAHGRPPRGDRGSFGSSGSILAHCASVTATLRPRLRPIRHTSQSGGVPRKSNHGKHEVRL